MELMDFVKAALDDGKTLPEEGRDDKRTNCFLKLAFHIFLHIYFLHIFCKYTYYLRSRKSTGYSDYGGVYGGLQREGV